LYDHVLFRLNMNTVTHKQLRKLTNPTVNHNRHRS
jgi:hypothetical protein